MNLDHRHLSLVDEFQSRHRAGLATLVFTDMAGSTRLKSELGDAMAGALMQKHHAVVRSILATFPEAREISTAGDSFFIITIRILVVEYQRVEHVTFWFLQCYLCK